MAFTVDPNAIVVGGGARWLVSYTSEDGELRGYRSYVSLKSTVDDMAWFMRDCRRFNDLDGNCPREIRDAVTGELVATVW
jgi:hypothetical protein